MAKALPVPQLSNVSDGITLLLPLSHRGEGPGLIVLSWESDRSPLALEDGVPSLSMKWAEEGYTVVEIRRDAWSIGNDPLGVALQELSKCDKCRGTEKVGIVAYDPISWSKAAPIIASHPKLECAVVYGNADSSIAATPVPILQHLAGPTESKVKSQENFTVYYYDKAKSYSFATPFSESFDYATESVSHTRNLTFLKPHLNGPYFDLEAAWDEHTYFEFETRDVPATMNTMVQEPYVNHVPVLTGGIGREKLSYFYSNHFVHQNPKDTELELVSRTVGIDRVIDEFIYKFTHDMQIDWLLPGIPPTYKYCEIPFMAVVNFRGDRLYHEHIMWDQLTTLVQLGLMPEFLPFPYSLPGGKPPAAGNSFEYQVPGVGKDTAAKMRQKNSVPSNKLFEFGVREVTRPN